MSFSPGMLSVFCALGTVVGLAFFVIGLFIKKKVLQTGGIVFFLISFVGLFFLIAKHGKVKPESQVPQEVNSTKQDHALLLSYETTVSSNGAVMGVWNRLQSWPKPLHFKRVKDSLFLVHGNSTLLSRGVEDIGNSVVFSSGEDSEDSQLLVGAYTLEKVGRSEWLWRSERTTSDGVLYLDMIFVNSPRPIGQ